MALRWPKIALDLGSGFRWRLLCLGGKQELDQIFTIWKHFRCRILAGGEAGWLENVSKSGASSNSSTAARVFLSCFWRLLGFMAVSVIFSLFVNII